MERDKLEQHLRCVLEPLRMAQEEAVKQMEETVTGQLQLKPEAWTKLWEIKTLLVPKDEVERCKTRGYVPMNEDISAIFHQEWNLLDGEDSLEERGHREYFWNGTYESWQDEINANQLYEGYFTDYEGKVQPFHYKLRPSHELMGAEKKLYEAARLYRIQRPVLFSPWSRRLVSIQLQDDILPMTAAEFFAGTYDFRWQENGLANKILEGLELMWNVALEREKDGSASIWPDPVTGATCDGIRFSNVSDRTFIILNELTSTASTAVFEKSSQVIKLYGDASHEAWRLDIQEIEQPVASTYPTLCFANVYELPRFGESRRLCTKGDILRTLQRYNGALPGVSIDEDISLKRPEHTKLIAPYVGDDVYGGKLDRESLIYQRERVRHLPECFIRFSLKWGAHSNHDYDYFLTDYARYVLADLNYRFPDFKWRGVIADE